MVVVCPSIIFPTSQQQTTKSTHDVMQQNSPNFNTRESSFSLHHHLALSMRSTAHLLSNLNSNGKCVFSASNRRPMRTRAHFFRRATIRLGPRCHVRVFTTMMLAHYYTSYMYFGRKINTVERSWSIHR